MAACHCSLAATMSRTESEPQPDQTSVHRPSRASSPAVLVLIVSGAVGFAIMGDSLLYAILPLAARQLVLSPQQVGLLLSANRLIRLFSNSWLGAAFARFGPYRTFVISAILGVVTTALYGFEFGFLLFLAARIGWGVAWSGLRQGTFQSIWAGDPADAGRLMGLKWGVVRGGSAISALIGGFLFDHFGFQTTVWIIAGLSAVAIPIAFGLSWPASASLKHDGEQQRSGSGSRTGNAESDQESRRSDHEILGGWIEALSDPLQRAVLLVGFFKLLLNSILVATASVFLADRFDDFTGGFLLGLQVGALAGIVLGTRWFSDLFLGAAMGALADLVGRIRLTLVLVFLLCLGLTLMLTVQNNLSFVALLGILIVSTGVNVVLDAYANQAALATRHPQMFVATYATASDLGSAVGPLFAFWLVASVGFATVYGIAALLVVLTLLYLVMLDARYTKLQTPVSGGM